VKKIVLAMCIFGFRTLTAAQSAPPLGAVQTFVVLGASTVTNTGPTVIVGNLGVSPGTAVTGFPPERLSAGAIHSSDLAAASAQADAQTAYNDLAADSCDTNLTGRVLGTTRAN
jgi:hypothetical protein